MMPGATRDELQSDLDDLIAYRKDLEFFGHFFCRDLPAQLADLDAQIEDARRRISAITEG